MISLIVSHTYIIPIGKRRNGHLIVNPSDATSPPRKREPVSPMKTFAGFQFQQRKPHIAPRSDAARSPNPANLSENAITSCCYGRTEPVNSVSKIYAVYTAVNYYD